MTAESDLRYLWAEHVARTRDTLLDPSNLPLLLQNQDRLGAVLGGPFGRSSDVAALLRQHIQGALDVVSALKAHADPSAAVRAWYANADQIAAALHGLSPAFGYEDVRAMMYRHLDLLTAEVKAVLAGDVEKGRNAFYWSLLEADDMARSLAASLRKMRAVSARSNADRRTAAPRPGRAPRGASTARPFLVTCQRVDTSPRVRYLSGA
jgi:hypothetical protein